MLTRLLIKDSPAFSEVIINPNVGFNVFSGISGSGKSVLIESILGLFGLKESNAILIQGDLDSANIYLEDEGILTNDELQLSVIKRDKIKYFINNQSSSKKRIKKLFSAYVKYIHSNSTSELSELSLINLLDLICSKKDASFSDLLLSYKDDYKNLINKKAKLEKLQNDEKNISTLKEIAIYEISHIESINPKLGEYDDLMELKRNLSKKEKTLEKIKLHMQTIDNFSSLLSFLESINKDKPIFEDILNEIEIIVRDEEEKLLNLNDDDIENILNRLESLGHLMHKYGSIEATLHNLEKKKNDLENYENISFNQKALQNEIDILFNEITIKAEEISKIRFQNIVFFLERLEYYCNLLMLSNPKLNLKNKELSSSGTNFLELKLEDSAIGYLSAGEFNRLKLAVLCIDMEYTKQSGILILDEIDANLSGSESEGVARILSFLSRDYQIFAISHQSHMPSLAHNHYLIQKNGTKSNIVLLTKEGRIKEIARMISGQNITDEALLFAKEKLKNIK